MIGVKSPIFTSKAAVTMPTIRKIITGHSNRSRHFFKFIEMPPGKSTLYFEDHISLADFLYSHNYYLQKWNNCQEGVEKQ